ncbi:hypothetical protein Tco_0381305 [Tanacetum coccineum]
MGVSTGSQESKPYFFNGIQGHILMVLIKIAFWDFGKICSLKKNEILPVIDILNFEHVILANKSQSLDVDAAKIISSTYTYTRSNSLPFPYGMNRSRMTEPLETSWDIGTKTTCHTRRGFVVEHCFNP